MNYEKFYKLIAKNIKRLRTDRHLTQEKLAEMSGISLDYLGKIEVNINKPGLNTIFKLAMALNASPAEFFVE